MVTILEYIILAWAVLFILLVIGVFIGITFEEPRIRQRWLDRHPPEGEELLSWLDDLFAFRESEVKQTLGSVHSGEQYQPAEEEESTSHRS